MQEFWYRTFARIFTFRLVALAITAFFVGWTVALTLQVILICVHFTMERLWLYSDWGLK